MTTPNELGRELGCGGRYVRIACRALWPRSEHEKYQRWYLTPLMVAEVTLFLVEQDWV